MVFSKICRQTKWPNLNPTLRLLSLTILSQNCVVSPSSGFLHASALTVQKPDNFKELKYVRLFCKCPGVSPLQIGCNIKRENEWERNPLEWWRLFVYHKTWGMTSTDKYNKLSSDYLKQSDCRENWPWAFEQRCSWMIAAADMCRENSALKVTIIRCQQTAKEKTSATGKPQAASPRERRGWVLNHILWCFWSQDHAPFLCH